MPPSRPNSLIFMADQERTNCCFAADPAYQAAKQQLVRKISTMILAVP